MNLEVVRHALLADARREAATLSAAAEEAVATALDAAREEAERMVDGARAEGEAEARRVAATEGARARREARERVLGARRAAYETLRAESRRAALALREDPRYPDLVDGLAHVAGHQLGDAAAVRVDEQCGGVVATAGSRSVDYRLEVVADRCLAAMGAEVEALWH